MKHITHSKLFPVFPSASASLQPAISEKKVMVPLVTSVSSIENLREPNSCGIASFDRFAGCYGDFEGCPSAKAKMQLLS